MNCCFSPERSSVVASGLVRRVRDNFCDAKGAPRTYQLGVSDCETASGEFHPDGVVHVKLVVLGTFIVPLLLLLLCLSQMEVSLSSNASCLRGEIVGPCLRVDRGWVAHVKVWECWVMVMRQKERGSLDGLVEGRIISEHHHGEVLLPFGRVWVVQVGCQKLPARSVERLALSIALWMECARPRFPNAHVFAQSV